MQADTHRLFVEYLVAAGYPRAAIVLEPSFPASSGKVVRPDIAIIQPGRKQLLAIFELKDRIGGPDALRLIDQLRQYFEVLSVPVYMAVPSDAPQRDGIFSVYFYSRGGPTQAIAPVTLPSYETLAGATQTIVKSVKERELVQTTSSLIRLSRLLGIGALVLALADVAAVKIGVGILTKERLVLFCFGAAVLLLPYLRKLKGLGIEVEQLVEPGEKKG